MATFKVGQRVRVIFAEGVFYRAAGHEAVIRGYYNGSNGYDWLVEVMEFPRCPNTADGLYGASSSQLEPLTDPKADAFLESMRKLKPYEEPTVKPRNPVYDPVSWGFTPK